MGKYLASALLLMTGGCVSLLPPPSKEVYEALGKTADALGEMRAAVALPGADRSYAAMRPFYARAYAGLDTAEAIVDQRAAASRGKLFSRPAKISREAVANCRKAIGALRDKTERSGIVSADFVAFPVVQTCAIPRLIEGDLTRGDQ